MPILGHKMNMSSWHGCAVAEVVEVTLAVAVDNAFAIVAAVAVTAAAVVIATTGDKYTLFALRGTRQGRPLGTWRLGGWEARRIVQ